MSPGINIDTSPCPAPSDIAASPAELHALVSHAQPGPRYTSYPPATEFSPAFGEAQARRELVRLRYQEPDAPVSLYAHIPFCPSLCWYCGCNVKVTRDRSQGTGYVDTLIAELGLIAELAGSPNRRRPVTEIALGGGSPNFLTRHDLERLIEAMRALFDVRPDAELGIELDPRTTLAEQVLALADAGFTRLSVGVQDFDPAVQQAIHRHQSRDQTAALVALARDTGFTEVSVDLIYGLPLQTLTSFAATLDAVLALMPERIALFGYAHLPARLPHQKLVERAGPVPGATERAQLFLMAMHRLTEAGYVRIGLDHFALPDSELARAARDGRLGRNFQGYVVRRAEHLLACGVTGISSTHGAYWQNLADLDDWRARVTQGSLPAARGRQLDRDDEVRRFVIGQLMCTGRLDFDDIDKQFGIHCEEYFAGELELLDGPEYRDLLAPQHGSRELVASPLGQHLVRNLCMVFDRYTSPDRAAGRHSLSI